jgi:peptidyl-prolyl cis-trans isomerase B (cyclophilin B)
MMVFFPEQHPCTARHPAARHGGLGSHLAIWITFAVTAAAHPTYAQLTPLSLCATSEKPIRLIVRDPDQPERIEEMGGPECLLPEITTVEPKDAKVRPSDPRNTPRAADERARLRIELRTFGAQEPLRVAPVEAGEVDLARIFPQLWDSSTPRTYCVQLGIARGREQTFAGVGPAVWLVPMITPSYAPRLDRDGAPVFTPARSQLSSGYWLRTDKLAVISTSAGDLIFRLRTDLAPTSVQHFRDLIDAGFYDDTPVVRVASLRGLTKPDVVQFGDPTGTGQGGPGFMIDLEPTALKHGFGVMSYARTTDPNSAGSQVIIGLNREGTAMLDGRYCAFAELVNGADTLNRIAKTPVDPDGKPTDKLHIRSARLIDAPPMDKAPEPIKDPSTSPIGR